MTSKEAVETLNKYRNQNYNSTNKAEVELANAINVILPKYVKQEKLLELYRELDDCIIAPTGHHVCRYTDDEKYARIRKQIKELENEKKCIRLFIQSRCWQRKCSKWA